jgi:hypothetical protein
VDFLVLVNEQKLSRLADRIRSAGFEVDETWLQWNPLLRGVQLRFQARDMLKLVFPNSLTLVII